jgi:pyruvate/2-oxoglutarate dehydrogenase complex dihydrolipoamide dehydrogenase (E3) component
VDVFPSRLLVLGAGYIGLEFSQMMHRFGSKVTVLARGTQILSNQDVEVAEALAKCLQGEGIEIQFGVAVEQVSKFSDGQLRVMFRTPKGEQEWTGSHLLVALGRSPVTKDLDIAAAGVETTAKGFIKVNDRLETNVTSIWAIGDVNGGPQFTHASLDDFRILRDNVFRKRLAAEAGEMIGTVQAFMIAGMPATKLRDAVLSHPTMVEGFNALFAAL